LDIAAEAAGGAVTQEVVGEPWTARKGASPAGPVPRILAGLLVGALVVIVAHALEEVPHSGLLVVGGALVLGSAWVLHREIGLLSFRRLTIPGTWYVTYLAMILVPSWFVFLSHPGPTRGRFIAGVLTLLASVPAGVALVNRLTRFSRQEIDNYLLAPLTEGASDSSAMRACVIGLGAALGIGCLYLFEVETVPLLHLLRHPGDAMNLVFLREESLKLLASPLTPIYSLLRTLGFPLLILVTLGFWLVRRRRRWLLLFGATLTAGLLYASLSIAKAPVAEIVLVGWCFLFLRGGGRVPRHLLILGAAAGLVLMLAFPFAVVLAVWFSTGVDPLGAMLSIGRRLFYLPAEVLYWYFTLFPGPEGYLHGRTVGDVSWIMGWEYFNAPNYVGRIGLGSRIASVNANGAFIGYLHADFGPIGVLLGGLSAGAIMQGLQVWLLRRPKTVLNLAIYAFLLFAFWLLHSTSLPIVLASNGVILLVLTPAILGHVRGGLVRLRALRGGSPTLPRLGPGR
jgi:hypothetical protein